MLKTINEYAEHAATIRQSLIAEARILVEPLLKDFMQNHPNLTAIGWTQYTPYFNDGEICVFQFNGLNATISPDPDTSSVYEDGWVEIWGGVAREGIDEKTWEDLLNLAKSLSLIEDELQYVFGDHTMIMVTRNSVDVEEYEHD